MTKLRFFLVASLLVASPMLAATQPTRTPIRPLAKAVASAPKRHVAHKGIKYAWCDSHACEERFHPLGKASFYGRGYWQGRKMANGERFDYRKMTVALWGLPLGTMVRVTNLENRKSIIVEVTDRGPAHALHRVADLSWAAAKVLDFVDNGLATVLVQPLADMEPELPVVASSLEEPKLVAQGALDDHILRVF